MDQEIAYQRFLQIIATAYEKGKNPVSLGFRQEVCTQLIEKVSQINRNCSNLEDFVEQTVNLIRDELGFYFICLLLINYTSENALMYHGPGNAAVMYGGSGEIAPLLIERAHHFVYLKPTSTGLINTAINTNVVVIGDPFTAGFLVGSLPQYPRLEPVQPLQFRKEIIGVTPDPLLPDARSQMVIPLRVKQGVIGVLILYSCVPDSFEQRDISIFLPLADHIAEICANVYKNAP